MDKILENKKILLGVCGSIATYKSAFLVRLLVKSGAEVKVVMTTSATEFVTPLTFSTLSKKECLVSYTRSQGSDWNNHIDLALWADLILIAPASTNTIAKMAHAQCDNLLLGIYLSARCPIFLAPAMDVDMYKHPGTQSNLERLKTFGNHILQVHYGELASGLVGEGRMAEPEEIVQYLKRYFSPDDSKLKGKTIVITAGPTYEHIDPVRFIGNHSSGKMGIALAESAASRGAKVTLILGPTQLAPKNPEIHVIKVVSGHEMYQQAHTFFDKLDIIIFAAAVADYTPTKTENQKIKKQSDTLTLHLEKNIDIADSFGKVKSNNQLSIGFALETNNPEEHAKNKIEKKKFDFVVLNSLTDKGAGFVYDTNKVTIINKDGNKQAFELKSKTAVAEDIMNAIENQLN